MHAQIHSPTFVDECSYLHVEVGNFSDSPRIARRAILLEEPNENEKDISNNYSRIFSYFNTKWIRPTGDTT